MICALRSHRPSVQRTNCADDNTSECAESKECHPAKHHYDECVERVTGQIENDGKASEDCVEECMSRRLRHASPPLTRASLPPRPLRHPVRRAEAFCSAQVEPPIPPQSNTPHASLIRSGHDTDTCIWDEREEHDTHWTTVNSRVMFRISVLLPHAKPRRHSTRRSAS